MANPLISVIIPNFCHASYLDQRIQSVLNQTYNNFEVIILDDCSPDNGASKAVIEKYRDNPYVSHIIYNEHNSGSTFKQWNKGFELAKGEIIWIAESDDYCELNFLETLMPCWEKYPNCSVIQSATVYIDSNSVRLQPEIQYSGDVEYISGREFIKRRLVCSNFYIPNASAVTFRKDVALSLEKDYMTFKSSGDSLFWIHMLEKGDICTVYKPLNYFRQHQNKVSSKKEVDGTQCKENFRIFQYLKSKGYIRTIIKNDAFRFYWRYITTYNFESEEVRKELLHLWFPWWKRNSIYLFYTKVYNRLYYFLNN